MPTLPADLFDPGHTETNRLPARPPLEPHADADGARQGTASPWRRSLDGAWRFRLVDRPGDAPARWTAPSTDDSRWRTIDVPGCWTRQDTGDRPHYTNIMMPWPGLEPPQVPDRNPTGLHRTTFRVPRSWRTRQVVLHLGGAESIALVWCNGDFVGMGKDSRLPSEFDLTPHLVTGPNVLAVMVIRYGDVTWIEDQDHWWHGGLHRSCYLEARGRSRIDDLTVVADYDGADGRGALTVTARVTGPDAASIRVTLETERGRRIATMDADVAEDLGRSPILQILSAYSHPGPVAVATATDLSVRPWTAESPTRHRVVTELLDPTGTVVEAHSTWTGFRRVEVRGRRLLVNGVPIVLHGVNRHDHDPVTGKTVSVEQMRAELVTMKRHNVDAVRTAHYPNDHRLLDLCDELGLYVVDEANVESHARWLALADDDRWTDAIVARTRRMVARDKNHPCVIGWSLGNEAGHGPGHDAAAAWARAVDPTRFVHYEGACFGRFAALGDTADDNACRAPSARERHTTDVVTSMYKPTSGVVAWARWAEATGLDDRPLVLCEFSHAMGNSNGSIVDYVDAFHAEPALAGGFVWDWRDQGLAETDEDGRFYWAYGGHFGEEIHDANFCINGLVGPDGDPHPALREYMWACRPVVAEQVLGRRLRFTNRRRFAATDDLVLHWRVTVDGTEHQSGQLDLVLAPGETRTINLPGPGRRLRGGEAHLDVRWASRRRSSWAERGHIVAWDQFTLREPTFHRIPTRPTPEPRTPLVTVGDDGIERVEFDGQPVVLGDIAGWLWRAPTDNDGPSQGWMAEDGGLRGRWVAWGLDRVASVVDDIGRRRRGADEMITLHRRLVGAEHEAQHRTRITVTADRVRFDERVHVPEVWDDVARVGVRFEAPSALSLLDWFGPGPDETYPDRRGAATVSCWSSTVDEQYHPYVHPQEHGAHVGTRWFRLGDRRHRGLRVDAVATPLAFSARRHHDLDLTAAATLAELERGDTVEVHVDTAIRGLGTAICGPDTLPHYRVGAGTHAWSWELRPWS